MATLAEIYDWFMTSKKPTQAQFWASWGSFWNKNESIPQSSISGLTSVLNAKVENDQFNAHKGANDAHAALFLAKEDKTQKGAPNGYAPLDEFTKLAAQYLNIVNDLVTGGDTALLSAEQGKVLQTQVNAINTLLTSDNVNLDTVQELVDAIETVQLSLSTILVNDLTTGGTTKALTAEMGKLLQTNKVDKVAGERLINAAEITKLAGLGNVITTVKTIVSTALGTQNVAGFVTYINALNPVLVVGANETVTYKTSDTGRVFKLLLRGRSFGVGQPAIFATDVIETTEFLNKDIRLSNYPSTRNDGQLPTNKVLAPDVNGNLKLYTIATAPAPYMEVLIPDSTLPSTTTNFTIKGAFFTPTMTVSIVGQTINYITFVSDNLIKVNVTTSAAEGSYAVTLNNGLSATFPNALPIVLGTVFTPLSSEWINKTGVIDTASGDSVKVVTYGSAGSATWNKSIDRTKNFRVLFKYNPTPLGSFPDGQYYNYHINLVNSSNQAIVSINLFTEYSGKRYGLRAITQANGDLNNIKVYNLGLATMADVLNELYSCVFSLRYVSGVLYLYKDNTLAYTFAQTFTENMNLKISIANLDIANIKYIETA